MNNKIKTLIMNTVGIDLCENGFYLADSGKKHIVFHRKYNNNDPSQIDIVQIAKDKYETHLTVAASSIWIDAPDETASNINYASFNEFCGDITKIPVDDCRVCCRINKKFHYGDVYLALGRGVIGVSPRSKKPCGIRLKKSNDLKLCKAMLKTLPRIYSWLNLYHTK